MTVEEAKALILREGYPGSDANNDAVFILVRAGFDPGQERMQQLLKALRIVFDATKGQAQIDRQIAAALWLLADSISTNLGSWERSGRKWREGLQEEALKFHTAVESIFFGEWFGTERR